MSEKLDLDALETSLSEGEAMLTAGTSGYITALPETLRQLIAAARRLEQLEDVMNFLDFARVDLVGQARHLPANLQNAVALATELGWDTKSKGGE